MIKLKTLKREQYILITLSAFLFLAMFFTMLQMLQNNQGISAVSIIVQTLISFPFLLLLTFLDFHLIKWINKNTLLNKNLAFRLFIELILGAVMATFFVLIANLILSKETNLEGLIQKFILNAPSVAAIFINSLMIFLLEFFLQYDRQRKNELEILNLKNENTEYLYNQLRSQINPHFLFNSLNVLSALINKDSDDAILFTKKLSNTYRYVLNHDREELVSLKQELEFAKNYMDILSIRFGSNLLFNLDLENEILEKQLPPMTLQLLIENAIKHNVVSRNKRLTIHIYFENNHLCVSNNLNKIKSGTQDLSSGIGLENLNNRFLMSLKSEILIEENRDTFTVKLPLI